jgi:phenylalanyl-tRNA synthetase beta chain
VAVALPGALLPGAEVPLEERPLRGEASRGMILSERELELGDDHSGIIVLEEGPEPGTPLADVLPIVERVLDVTPTMNRGDLLSVYGIAREVAALFRGELREMPGDDPPITHPEWVDVKIEDTAGCPRYIGRVFRDVRVGPSPAWLRARLRAAGMRAISNVVDVTNYVMHAFGSPLHAFDHDRLAEGRIVVRRAQDGEEFRTLDGQLRRMTAADLMIADGERSVAIAGVMGGLESEVGEETTSVLLEAANFEPLTVLRTSERLGLRSEASNRWEKGVDPTLAERAAVHASRLIVDLTGARMTGATDQNFARIERSAIRLRPERTDAIVGLVTPPDEQRAILAGFGFAVDDAWDVTVPTWRARDVTREIDLVEEVARAVLERVPHTLPLRRHVRGRLTKEQRLRRLVEDVLVGAGFSEAYTWSLRPSDPHPDAIGLRDPLSADQALLRTTVLTGLVEAAQASLDAGAERVALFEIARVYLPSDEPLPEERWQVGGIVSGGYLAAKGALETLYGALHLDLRVERDEEPPPFLHPGRAARTEAGLVAELHPTVLEGSWGVFELDLDRLFAGVEERVEYEELLTYPALRQDIAVAVPEEVETGALVDAAREASGPELREARVFDVYHGEQVGEGRKSVALHLVFQSPDRTLSDEDAAALRGRIVEALAERFGAELRA